MSRNIIMINGLKQSGKNYIGELLALYLASHNIVSTQLAFAEDLKKDVAKLLDISLEELEARKNEEMIRKLLQNYGMLRREEDEFFWIDKTIDKIKQEQDNSNNVIIITDWRFLLEHEVFNAAYTGNIITINVFDYNQENTDKHISENNINEEVFKFDFFINNTDKTRNIIENMSNLAPQFETLRKNLV